MRYFTGAGIITGLVLGGSIYSPDLESENPGLPIKFLPIYGFVGGAIGGLVGFVIDEMSYVGKATDIPHTE